MRFEKEFIVIEPIDNPRDNWDIQFEKMNENKDDELLIPDVFTDENLDEWK